MLGYLVASKDPDVIMELRVERRSDATLARSSEVYKKRAKPPATIMPKAETPLKEASPLNTIGDPVGDGAEPTPVDATGEGVVTAPLGYATPA